MKTVKDWVKVSAMVMETGVLCFSHVPAKVMRMHTRKITEKIRATVRYWEGSVLSFIISVGTSPAMIAPRAEKIILVDENRALTV